MLIRSQDKKQLLNLTNMDFLYVESDMEISKIEAFFNGNRTYIGQYSTEDKAIKVLDMIQTNYADTRSDNQTFAFDYPKVFQMPSQAGA